MSRESKLTICFALVIAMGCRVSNAAAQTDKYPRMAAASRSETSPSVADPYSLVCARHSPLAKLISKIR
jgi:hypothetical protein